MDLVAEGVKTAKVVMELAEQYGVDMPITAEVAGVCAGTAPAESAYRGLLKRSAASERG